MNSSKLLLRPPCTAHISRALYHSPLAHASTTGLRSSYTALHTHSSPARQFSTTRPTRLDFFPPNKNAPSIKLTPPAWQHAVCNAEQLKSITVAHRETKSWSDYVAFKTVQVLRWATDVATGYRHDPSKPYVMSERKWLVRFVFLETVAGVPGMVGGMLRHLRSLAGMRRDHGWIETLLEDAYNERMHLLTFLTMAQPGWFMKTMVLGAQGVFTNGFFVSYLLFPKTCHRFVGYLEEEAVKTYSFAIDDLEAGRLPAWEHLDAPEIAIKYWNMPEGKRKMIDLLYYVRADEAKHREIHHTLSNLDQAEDPNPFVSEYKDLNRPHPGKGIEYLKPKGWERDEIL